MPTCVQSIIVILWMSWPCFALAEENRTPATRPVTAPFWQADVMSGESALFIRKGDDRPAAALLFKPLKIVRVTSSDGRTVYQEGRDFVVEPGSRRLLLPEGSTIPSRTVEQLTPPKGSQPFGLVRRDGHGDILFGASHEYADLQVLVTYQHGRDGWDIPPPRLAKQELPQTLGILRAGRPLKLVLFGDSISTGCNASKWAQTQPFQPSYEELLVEQLSGAYKSVITFRNHSQGGQTAAWGLANIEKVAAEKPDLVILAWGMNDGTGENGGFPVDVFIANLKAQMAAVRRVQPDAEFILVASMLPNKEWRLANPDRLLEYRDAMRKLVEPGVTLADLSTVWQAMLGRKNYLDLTGNGVNHPNDFGHRVYAQVIAGLLIPQKDER